MTRLAEAEAQPNVVLTETTADRDRLGDKVDHLSSDWNVLSV